MSRYFLSPHVYLCITDDHAVLLDLQHDKYVGIGRAQMRALAACVSGWPVSEVLDATDGKGEASAPPGGKLSSVVAKMLSAGMLTTDASVGKEARPVAIERPERELLASDLEARPQVGLRDALSFLRATAAASFQLRCFSILHVVIRVRARKARCSAEGSSFDFEAARRLVGAFVHLRPWLFGAQDACLFDSLAIVELLAGRGLFPTWVFGVQTAPFAAHCWVQHGDVVFNDSAEQVRRFTPILTV